MAVEADAYDAWFCAQVQAALEDARSGPSQVQVTQAVLTKPFRSARSDHATLKSVERAFCPLELKP